MVDVKRLEELGRMIMSASVEAEYLRLPGAVSYLDGAFADVVRVLAVEREREVGVERVKDLESARGAASAS